MKRQRFTGKFMETRITNSKGWTIAIDNGWSSYVFKLKACNTYSIASLFEAIQKTVKK